MFFFFCLLAPRALYYRELLSLTFGLFILEYLLAEKLLKDGVRLLIAEISNLAGTTCGSVSLKLLGL